MGGTILVAQTKKELYEVFFGEYYGRNSMMGTAISPEIETLNPLRVFLCSE
jgi:hypothetical protein